MEVQLLVVIVDVREQEVEVCVDAGTVIFGVILVVI
jgi:hypothetical protein